MSGKILVKVGCYALLGGAILPLDFQAWASGSGGSLPHEFGEKSAAGPSASTASSARTPSAAAGLHEATEPDASILLGELAKDNPDSQTIYQTWSLIRPTNSSGGNEKFDEIRPAMLAYLQKVGPKDSATKRLLDYYWGEVGYKQANRPILAPVLLESVKQGDDIWPATKLWYSGGDSDREMRLFFLEKFRDPSALHEEYTWKALLLFWYSTPEDTRFDTRLILRSTMASIAEDPTNPFHEQADRILKRGLS